MIKQKVSSVCPLICLCLVQLIIFSDIAQSVEIECIPLKLCPMAVRLVKTKKYNPETIHFLRYSHCGYDDQGPKVWCNKFTYCKTPDEKNGTCTEIEKCKSFLQIMDNIDTSNILTKNYLRKFRCSTEYDKKVRVCCPDDEFYADNLILNTVVPEKRSHQVTLPNPEQRECGIQEIDLERIYGGTQADLTEHPWMAVLMYDSKKGLKFACAGTLITNRYILTAAHCVDNYTLAGKGLGKLRQVVLGEYDIKNKTDCFYFKYGQNCADPPVYYEVESFIKHERYTEGGTSNDIALIRLLKEVKYSDYIKPICLPSEPTPLKGNQSFTIAGWGTTELTSKNTVKRRAMVKYNNSNKCNELSRFNLTDRQICVGNGAGVDSCSGDSGGPLMLNRVMNSEIVTFLYGIISYGFQPCGTQPSVYTYVPNYIDWIKENML